VLCLVVSDFITELKTKLPEVKIEAGNLHTSHLGNNGQAVVFPKSEQEIAEVLKFANRHGKKVNVMGNGTKRGFGGLVETADLLLCLAEYKGIVEHIVGDMTLTVKAGTPFKELQTYLAKFNQQISLDPSNPEHATIGGIIAANDSGPKRLGYGAARDVVIGLRMVYPDGTIIRSGGKVVKNVAGYDMNKLYIGSMGTLGVISEITVKLRPLPKYESVIVLSFSEGDLEEARSFVRKLLDSMMEPVALELINPTLSERLIGERLYSVAVSFEDLESSVLYQQEFVKSILPRNAKVKILQQDKAESFWNEFYSISPNGVGSEEKEQIEAALKIGVVNMDVFSVIRESHLLEDSHNILVESNGGLGHGLCQINLKGSSDDILSAIDHVRKIAVRLGGYAVVKHLPYALRKQVKVWGEEPAHFFLLEGIKAKVDPNRILNDKRFVGGI
jgi:glycolate oxidase FAD binding subunit